MLGILLCDNSHRETRARSSHHMVSSCSYAPRTTGALPCYVLFLQACHFMHEILITEV